MKQVFLLLFALVAAVGIGGGIESLVEPQGNRKLSSVLESVPEPVSGPASEGVAEVTVGLMWIMVVVATMVIGLGIYFIPSFVAARTQHKYSAAIVVLNLLLGWSFLGWVVALVWACMACPNSESQHDSVKGSKEFRDFEPEERDLSKLLK